MFKVGAAYLVVARAFEITAEGLTGGLQFSEDGGGTIQIAMGLAMVASFVWTHMQRQLSALVEIVKRLEHERS